MNKALDILKKFSNLHESAYGFNSVMIASLGDINDAIKELEAHKTCEGCKLDNGIMKVRSSPICAYCVRVAKDYYEPKDKE